jgi:hypothetical protein
MRSARRDELTHRGVIEMVVVIVGDQHHVELGHLRRRERQREEAALTHQRVHPCRAGEHRVDQHARAVDLHDRRGVPEPRHAQARVRCRGEVLVRDLHHRHALGRHAIFAAPERPVTHGAPADLLAQIRVDTGAAARNDIIEVVVAPLRRLLHASETLTLCAHAQR